MALTASGISLFLLAIASPVASQGNDTQQQQPGLVTINSTYGPDLTLEHLYYDQWPTGITVTSSGRLFSNYPRGESPYTVAELVDQTTEVAYPNNETNSPPSLANASNPGYATGYRDYFISSQSVVVDAIDRLWVLDTGRPIVNGSRLLAYGEGPKLVAYSTEGNASGEPLITITFPRNVVYADSYLNDVRFDLRSDVSSGGHGVAYVTDSSDEGRNGLVVVDIGTGESWRHLDSHPSTLADASFVPSYNGQTHYPVSPSGPNAGAWSRTRTGSDGIAISADGEYLYYCPLGSRDFYRIATRHLRTLPSSDPAALLRASAAVEHLGGRPSHADGLEADSEGIIYISAPETNGILTFNPDTLKFSEFVRAPEIQWPDTLAVSTDNKLYFTVNQLWLQDSQQNGTDRRVKPYGLYSVPISGGRVELTD